MKLQQFVLLPSHLHHDIIVCLIVTQNFNTIEKILKTFVQKKKKIQHVVILFLSSAQCIAKTDDTILLMTISLFDFEFMPTTIFENKVIWILLFGCFVCIRCREVYWSIISPSRAIYVELDATEKASSWVDAKNRCSTIENANAGLAAIGNTLHKNAIVSYLNLRGIEGKGNELALCSDFGFCVYVFVCFDLSDSFVSVFLQARSLFRTIKVRDYQRVEKKTVNLTLFHWIF